MLISLPKNLNKIFELNSTALVLQIRQHSLNLLESITLALHGRDIDKYLDEADKIVIRLRILLRLMTELHPERQGFLLDMSQLLTQVGKQLGGWQKARKEA